MVEAAIRRAVQRHAVRSDAIVADTHADPDGGDALRLLLVRGLQRRDGDGSGHGRGGAGGHDRRTARAGDGAVVRDLPADGRDPEVVAVLAKAAGRDDLKNAVNHPVLPARGRVVEGSSHIHSIMPC